MSKLALIAADQPSELILRMATSKLRVDPKFLARADEPEFARFAPILSPFYAFKLDGMVIVPLHALRITILSTT